MFKPSNFSVIKPMDTDLIKVKERPFTLIRQPTDLVKGGGCVAILK